MSRRLLFLKLFAGLAVLSLFSVPALAIEHGQEVAKQEQPATQPSDQASEKEKKKHEQDIKKDQDLGKKYSEEVEKDPTTKLSKNEKLIARVSRIGQEIAEIANRNEVSVSWGDSRLNAFNYTFHVIQGEDVNAFSLPGGYIYVYEGLLKYVESDDELAGVLAHEISHAAFRHLAVLQKEQEKFDIIALPAILIAVLTGGDAGAGVATAGTFLRQAVGSGWSVKAETAADFGGLQYILKSKYNPVGLVTFIERLAYDDRFRPNWDLGIYRTHPPTRERARALMDHLKEANIQIRRSDVSTTLRCEVKPGDDGTVELSYAGIKLYRFAGTEALSRADESAARLNLLFDDLPKLYDFTAEENVIVGKGHQLFEVLADDAKQLKTTIPDLVDTTVKALKHAAYDLAYRVWDAY